MNTYHTRPRAAESHVVQLCPNKSAQAKLLTNYISEGLLNNEAVIVIARPVLRKALWTKLQALGLDMVRYKARGQIKLYDAELLLSTILLNDVVDEHYFHTFIGSQIEAARATYGKVRAFGEMVEILWQRGLRDTALQLETIRNDLGKKYELTVLCTHLRDSLDPQSYNPALEHICKCQTYSLPMNAAEGGGTLLELFGTAWDRAISQLTHSKDHLRSSAVSSL